MRKSENEIGVMISITGAKEWPGKIKQVTSVYVQYKKLSNSSFNRCMSICLNLEILTITYSSYSAVSNLNSESIHQNIFVDWLV